MNEAKCLPQPIESLSELAVCDKQRRQQFDGSLSWSTCFDDEAHSKCSITYGCRHNRIVEVHPHQETTTPNCERDVAVIIGQFPQKATQLLLTLKSAQREDLIAPI